MAARAERGRRPLGRARPRRLDAVRAEDDLPARIKPPGRLFNFVEDLAAYRALCQSADFQDAEIIDAREECAVSFLRACIRFLRSRCLAGAIDRETLTRMSGRMSLYVMNIRHYPLVAARKG